MAFCDNLLYLRKKAKITQEDLASELNVSRQSVSKWETGEAYPETDKLIALCDKFGVTMDEMVRGNCCGVEEAPKIAEIAEAEEVVEERDEPVYTNAQEYKKKIHSFARAISIGVFLIFCGVAACVSLGKLSERFDSQSGDTLAILGVTVLLLFIATAVALFVYTGISSENFHRNNPRLGKLFTKEERTHFEKKFGIVMACLVSGILLNIIMLIIACVLAERFAGDDLLTEIMCYCVSVFLFLLGGIIGGLCYMGITHDKINHPDKKTNGQQGPVQKLCDGICGTIMLTATAIYLLIGFVWDLWHPGWIVFPVGGILCGIVNTIGKVFEKREDK